MGYFEKRTRAAETTPEAMDIRPCQTGACPVPEVLKGLGLFVDRLDEAPGLCDDAVAGINHRLEHGGSYATGNFTRQLPEPGQCVFAAQYEQATGQPLTAALGVGGKL
jgi:hypothetical protein